jgi:hypothetical protein
MSAIQAARPLQSPNPTPTHEKRLFTPVNLSLMYFTQDIKVQITPFCVKRLSGGSYVIKYVAHGNKTVLMDP